MSEHAEMMRKDSPPAEAEHALKEEPTGDPERQRGYAQSIYPLKRVDRVFSGQTLRRAIPSQLCWGISSHLPCIEFYLFDVRHGKRIEALLQYY